MNPSTICILISSVLVSASGYFRPVLLYGDKEPLPYQKANYAKYRLPGPTIPSHYTIVLRIDPNDPNDSFTGDIAIDISTDTPVNKIILHSNVTIINNITVMAKESTVNLYDCHTISSDDTHFLTINLTQNLTVGQVYVININFINKYRKNGKGVYLSSYKNSNNTMRRLATTQFEPVYAREAFPCYDEPGLKAIFQMNIYTPPGYFALYNTDQINVSTLPAMLGDFKLFSFEPTVQMSSYLNAFVISDFVHNSNFEQPSQIFSKKFRVFSKPDTENYTNFALDIGQKIVNFMEKFTNVTYALSKLDNIGIPNFPGGMENWGLIIYGEKRLLDTPEITTTEHKQSIVTLMSHEISHLWFGDEVSPAWWDYLWLSEGFATYFGCFITQAVAPEWRMTEQNVIEHIHQAMLVDSLESSNPMTASVASPQEIKNIIDKIRYAKSASVIRMMEHILGTEVFRQGLQNYLKSIPLGLAEPQKLFDGLQAAVDGKNILPNYLTVNDVFGIWSTQAGYPLVEAINGENGSINLKQSRFYQTSTTSSEKWWIPITWVTSKGGDFQNTFVQKWFSPNDTVLNIPLDLDDDSWFILNKQETGYYRVMYDEKNWKHLTAALKAQNFSGIHLLNRAQLIDDSLELARTLRMTYTTTFDVLSYLKEETDYIPWLTFSNDFLSLDKIMPAATYFNKYREFLLQITDKVYKSVGFEPKPDDDYITRMKRSVILKIACNAGNIDCRKKSNEKLEQLTQNYNMTIDPDVKDIIHCSGIRNATKDLWKFFWNKYNTSTSSTEKNTILQNLACSEDINILQEYLLLAVSADSGLPLNDRNDIINNTINSGYVGVNQVVQFITTNFSTIQSIMPNYTISLINDISDNILIEENMNEFNLFAQTGNFTENEKSAIETAQSKIIKRKAELDKIIPDIDSWLLKNVMNSAPIKKL